jgi:hypothetical protein
VGWLSRPLFKLAWFWAIISTFASLHVLAVISFDWSKAANWTGVTFVPVAWADVTVMSVIIYAVFRWKYGSPVEAVADLPHEPSYSERDFDL